MSLAYYDPKGLSRKKNTAPCWKITAHHVIEGLTQQHTNRQVSVFFMRVRKTHASLNSFHCLQFRLWLQLWRGGRASSFDLCTKILCWRFVIFPSNAELDYGTQTSCFSCNSLWRCRSGIWKMALRTSIQNVSWSYSCLEKQPERYSLKTLPHRVCSGRSWWYIWEQFKRFPPPAVYSTMWVSGKMMAG